MPPPVTGNDIKIFYAMYKMTNPNLFLKLVDKIIQFNLHIDDTVILTQTLIDSLPIRKKVKME